MQTKDVVLFVFDEYENFHAEQTQLKLAPNCYKEVILVSSEVMFSEEYSKLPEDQTFVLVCHVSHALDPNNVKHRVWLKFKNTGIELQYGIKAHLVSSGDSGEVMKSLYEIEEDRRAVYSYGRIVEEIQLDNIKPNKKEGATVSIESIESNQDEKRYPEVEFGIITALYKDEFEEVKKHFVWDADEDIFVGDKRYWIGHLLGDPSAKIVAAIPSATGMVDSAIIATQMLELFKPKFLLMSGVCGGKSDTNVGDIVLAKQIFTFQKGKVSDLKNEDGQAIDLFDKEGERVDYDMLFDEHRNQIKISVEKFEIEHDAILYFELKDLVEPELKGIREKINAADVLSVHGKTIDIHFEPMACSTMVINKEGFFEDHIKVVDRKTVAVEMESYGVARACEFGNQGKTKWVIFKSVMDNMSAKTDEAKKFAAHTSGLFLKHLIYDGILK
jgi:nucleoside phosphorylase